ncbi:hypothetical protein I7I53_01036 [Histoplasma capsulatum var. duboisii H88]|uniref:Uncharacterized protein n=1 Tax=Ajellomyces capsulatus (strain H88) TaxID=544711 RepID=A0A8A1LH55_AJEC8|nr:hypothetical protein I7I53_01036 [Histoplasma capsulatum var. duboisii H88]
MHAKEKKRYWVSGWISTYIQCRGRFANSLLLHGVHLLLSPFVFCPCQWPISVPVSVSVPGFLFPFSYSFLPRN